VVEVLEQLDLGPQGRYDLRLAVVDSVRHGARYLDLLDGQHLACRCVEPKVDAAVLRRGVARGLVSVRSRAKDSLAKATYGALADQVALDPFEGCCETRERVSDRVACKVEHRRRTSRFGRL
jgi:hypothetical protein